MPGRVDVRWWSTSECRWDMNRPTKGRILFVIKKHQHRSSAPKKMGPSSRAAHDRWICKSWRMMRADPGGNGTSSENGWRVLHCWEKGQGFETHREWNCTLPRFPRPAKQSLQMNTHEEHVSEAARLLRRTPFGPAMFLIDSHHPKLPNRRHCFGGL